MALPISQDTTANLKAFALKDRATAIRFTAGADYSQGDFAKAGNFFGVVAEDVANGSVGSLLIEPHTVLQATQAGVTFAVGDPVYWTGTAFAKAYAAGYYLVGVAETASASNVFTFVSYGVCGITSDIVDTVEIIATGEHIMATADEDITATGVLATDIVVASMLSEDSTKPVGVLGIAEADNINLKFADAVGYDIIAAGEHAMATADEDVTLSGALATDIVVVSYLSYDTTGAGTLTAEAETDNISITASEATTGDGVVSYVVMRAKPAATGDGVASYVVLRTTA